MLEKNDFFPLEMNHQTAWTWQETHELLTDMKVGGYFV
jgi:hypothetical protein